MTMGTTKMLICLLLAAMVFSMTGCAADSVEKYDVHDSAVVHNNLPIEGTTSHKKKASYKAHGRGPIRLQDHGNPICFRNMWIRELPEQPYRIK